MGRTYHNMPTREKTRANRARILERFGGPNAESEITVKKPGTKFEKFSAQGEKLRRSYFTAKRDFRRAGDSTRDFLEDDTQRIGRCFTDVRQSVVFPRSFGKYE